MHQILVLEDDANMRSVMQEVLEDEGYEVAAVGSGLEALRACRQHDFDLIVADVRMQGMDGLKALEEARELLPQVGSLVVSGYADEKDSLRAVQLQVGGFLKKPFSAESFLAEVKTILARRDHELERVRETRSLSKALLNALEMTVSLADRHGLVAAPGYLVKAGRLGFELSLAAGLSGEVARQVEMGAMLAWLARLPGAEPPQQKLGELSTFPVLRWVLEQFELRHEDHADLTLEARLAALAVAVTQLETADKSAASEKLWQNDPGRLDPTLRPLLEGLGSGPQKTKAATEDDAPSVASLLSLGHTLENAGDRANAAQAYEEVLEIHPRSREALQARLGLARLSEGAEMLEQTLAVRELAHHLGPVTEAQAELQLGLLLLRPHPEPAKELLEQARSRLQHLGLSEGCDQALAALWSLGLEQPSQPTRQAVLRLLNSQNASARSSCVSWLLPALLSDRLDQELTAVLLRLIRDFPGQVIKLLLRGALQPEQRTLLLRALESGEIRASRALLATLSRDTEPALRQRATSLLESHQGQFSAPLLEVRSLGYFEVLRGSEPIPDTSYKTQKVKFLLPFLLSHPGRRVTEDVIIDTFWANDDRERGKKSLYTASSSLRVTLRAEEGDLDYIVREKEFLGFNSELPLWHDLEELEGACALGLKAQQAKDPELAASHYRKAVDLYRGPYLEGCYMDWAQTRRLEVDTQVGKALQSLAEMAVNRGAHQQALEYGQRCLDFYPERQDLHLLVMNCLLQLGQPEGVLRQYERCQRYLRENFDIEPNTDLIRAREMARLLG